ncbi:PAS domain-containing hybrid sensor histidine kinase/response regulator [Isachenkonia alkalipeptolytica]|uniref:Circadian input-output histidine kinase CikA n=1 Tax=Isachenkonia alkalipeptolytica TaxID=2565777 RepID=A0AA43XLE9_9CLOT|nr:PAS domain-containing hybrid sensor histidine kinase/response regulator [Isachenkonia alkalipeptolytica]NBG88476.1 PAS domain S-box protein [Isachenkonia alkalipeptolytica]
MFQREFELLEGIIDTISDPIIIKSRELNVLRCNPAGYKLIGAMEKRQRLVGKCDSEVDVSEKAVNTGKISKSKEHIKIQKSYFQKVASPILNNEGEVTHVVEQFKEITELIEKRNELDVYFSSSLDLLCIANMEGRFLRLNPQWEEVLGYTTEELKDKEILEFLHTEDILSSYEVIKDLGNDKEVKGFINRYRCKNGTYRWLEWRAKPVGKKIYAVARDITEQEKNKRRLEVSEEKYKTLVEQSTEMLYLHDLQGQIIDVNKTACKEMGYKREELLRLNILNLHPYKGKQEFFEQMWHKWTKNEIIEFSTGHITKKGKVLDVEIRARKISFGGKQYVMALVRDVTESRKIQQTLIRAKRNAESANLAKTRFLANMSHEIRTPMNGIRGFLQLLEETPLSEEQKEYIEHIDNSSINLLNIINDILDLSKIEAGEISFDIQGINLKETIDNIVHPFEYRAKSKGLDYEVDISDNLCQEVNTDATKLMQIVTNLITNAIKFTPGGKVRVKAEAKDKDEKHIILILSVKDSGIGLKKSEIKEIFLPFNQADDTYTRSYGGTGLGLAIVKELLGVMEGEISINSTYGEGSFFEVRMPLEKVTEKVGCHNKDGENE